MTTTFPTAGIVGQLHARPLVIIESPCAASPTHSWDAHMDYLAEALRHSALQMHEAPIASHGLFAFSHAFDDASEHERHVGMLSGWAWMRAAQKLIVYADLGISPGMQQAIALAPFFPQLQILYRYIRSGNGPLGTFTAPHPANEKSSPDE
jgi:hypothetical protein